MDVTGGMMAGVAGRYASALFDLARENRSIDAVGASLDRLAEMIGRSSDLREVTTSPMISRDAATNAVMAVAADLGLDPLVRNFVGVVGRGRRLGALPAIISAYRQMSATHRGETTAHVTAAHALDERQMAALKAKLRAGIGRDVAVDLTVDPAIMGGLIVKVGSRQIDSSIRTKLEALSLAMKG